MQNAPILRLYFWAAAAKFKSASASMSKAKERDGADPLPENWVRYAYQSETRFFVLAATCKFLWSGFLIGLTVLNLEIYRSSGDDTLKYVFGYMGAGLAYCLSGECQTYFSALLGSRLKARLAARVAEHAILRGSPDSSERSLALSLASSDAQSVCQGALTLFDLCISPFWFVVVVLILALRVNLKFGMIGAAMAVCVLTWMALISVLLTRAKKEINAAESKQISTFVESLENVRTLRFYGWDTYMLKKLHKMTDDMLPMRQRLLVLKMINLGTSFIASPLMIMCLLFVRAWEDDNVDHSIDEDFYFNVGSLFDLIKYPLLLLPTSIRATSGAAASYRRIYNFFNLPTFEDTRESTGTAGSLVLIDFPVGPATVLKEWCVAPGSLWILQGPVKSFKVCGQHCASVLACNPRNAEYCFREHCRCAFGTRETQLLSSLSHRLCLIVLLPRSSSHRRWSAHMRRWQNELRPASSLAAAGNNQGQHCLLRVLGSRPFQCCGSCLRSRARLAANATRRRHPSVGKGNKPFRRSEAACGPRKSSVSPS